MKRVVIVFCLGLIVGCAVYAVSQLLGGHHAPVSADKACGAIAAAKELQFHLANAQRPYDAQIAAALCDFYESGKTVEVQQFCRHWVAGRLRQMTISDFTPGAQELLLSRCAICGDDGRGRARSLGVVMTEKNVEEHRGGTR